MENEPRVIERGAERPSARRLVVVAIVVVVVGVGAFLGAAWGRPATSAGGTISVSGSGTVHGTPDTLSFDVGVQETASTATAALEADNARVTALIKALVNGGLPREDLATSGLSLNPNTNQYGVVTGFSVSNTLTVTTHKLGRAGAVLDAAAHAVGNGIQINGITLSISNQSHLLAMARARAMANAHATASQLATGGHATLGAIVRVTDQENSAPIVYPTYGFYKAAAATSVPIESGRQALNVQVTVVYQLRS